MLYYHESFYQLPVASWHSRCYAPERSLRIKTQVTITLVALTIIVIAEGIVIHRMTKEREGLYSKEEVQKICTNVRVQTQFDDSLAELGRVNLMVKDMENK